MYLNKIARQRDGLATLKPYTRHTIHATLGMAADGIVFQLIAVHALGKGGLDACTLLVDGVVKRIDKAVDGRHDLVVRHTVAHQAIIAEQLITIVDEMLELYAVFMP